MWAARRATNREVTIPHGAAQLERVGNVMNFRLAGGQEGVYRGGNDDFGTHGTVSWIRISTSGWRPSAGSSRRPPTRHSWPSPTRSSS